MKSWLWPIGMGSWTGAVANAADQVSATVANAVAAD
jgi:hypothetical protein